MKIYLTYFTSFSFHYDFFDVQSMSVKPITKEKFIELCSKHEVFCAKGISSERELTWISDKLKIPLTEIRELIKVPNDEYKEMRKVRNIILYSPMSNNPFSMAKIKKKKKKEVEICNPTNSEKIYQLICKG